MKSPTKIKLFTKQCCKGGRHRGNMYKINKAGIRNCRLCKAEIRTGFLLGLFCINCLNAIKRYEKKKGCAAIKYDAKNKELHIMRDVLDYGRRREELNNNATNKR